MVFALAGDSTMTSPFGNGFLSWLKLARKCEAVSYQLSALGSASIGSRTPTFSSLLQLLPPAVRNLPVKEGEDRVLARGGIQVRSPTQSRYGETAQTQRLLSGMIPQRYWLRPKRMRDASGLSVHTALLSGTLDSSCRCQASLHEPSPKPLDFGNSASHASPFC